MSKMILDLIGKDCIIKSDEAPFLTGKTELKCRVLDADDEWIKLTYTDAKNISKTKILRIDSIDNIEVIE